MSQQIDPAIRNHFHEQLFSTILFSGGSAQKLSAFCKPVTEDICGRVCGALAAGRSLEFANLKRFDSVMKIDQSKSCISFTRYNVALPEINLFLDCLLQHDRTAHQQICFEWYLPIHQITFCCCRLDLRLREGILGITFTCDL